MAQNILGLCGYAGSGKDALGKLLVERHGFKRIAFADALKRHCMARGWDGQKDEKGRRLLQEVGMEMRDRDPDFWVSIALDKIDRERIVFTDVRFPNEVRAIRSLGGAIVRIIRPGVGPVNDHVSEVACDGIKADYDILNDGDLTALAQVAESLALL